MALGVMKPDGFRAEPPGPAAGSLFHCSTWLWMGGRELVALLCSAPSKAVAFHPVGAPGLLLGQNPDLWVVPWMPKEIELE